ncbi:TPA: AAA family ATPase [Legionella pneumophila]|nr:UvrD-helicase domain-containing protein [Legionella pneumophila]MDW8877887.1 UvrD-helicase domain-containing protein [Legionella pneumophila subsp. fraseri]MDW8960926.1 UvrD-helicase domain-containing protein [Legionella pneumophila subsp. fraseri]MDW9035050.1 UvrD-helicase domain-containing protein [Legionella pneumophila subsp. fraseri]MDW9038112.1 UvrD-helicase domain-containing protein [Legionella pneumophila subsp. fraseri]MDW9041172.1 UvrD-helicase domain-containing protein [Legionell
MPLIDSEQRSQATDPAESFIVQAPAGSGKTEILTQRFLRLLSTVQSPEQIIALTFTRKAASEMRERIVQALHRAASNQPAASAHQQSTLNFAKQALQRNEQYQWDLLEQPNRLKIITIDSLCQSINRAIPLLEKQVAYPDISATPESHYIRAARCCIQYAIATPEYQKAIKTLLLHVDNKQERLIQLFQSLLSQRDQWLPTLFLAREQEKSTFEQALRLIEQHELSRLRNSLPSDLAQELVLLSRELASIENKPDSPRFILREWYEFQKCDQQIVSALSKLLLTGDNQLRKYFDHHVGLIKKDCTANEFNRIKTLSGELLSKLKDYPDFLDALLKVNQLPIPEYDKEQWDVLQALFLLLPLLVGHLQVSFSEHNEVDFAAISQQALAALGELDNPTDLALYLDHAIHHLLVDEFQDTSITQFELLTKLVQGWEPGDGKTLFLVGDPMQSIYRFRQAEVGLFFQAKKNGIGPIHLKSLELSCNFRSTETIVSWVNYHFSKIFSQQVDIESGAVSFHPSVHVIENNESSTIQALQFKNREHEAKHLIQIINNELNSNPEQTIAVLVRTRTQLPAIISLLRQNNIPYQGTDIDLLANLVHLRDVWSLAHALLFPGNRLSWLSVLHSPYVGLGLSDIHRIAQYNSRKSIYHNLLHLDKIQDISEEGRFRANFFIQVMSQALLCRSHSRLSDWIANTLKNLHVEKILDKTQLNDLEQLWVLLDQYEKEGRIPDMNEFLNEFNKLYAQQTAPSRLQIMTIHKSKGLEFDTVILPGLGAQTSRGDSPMLRWLNLPTQHHGNLLLVSPIKSAQQDNCPLYDYLDQLDEEKSGYEAQRLLYVAVTRAKSRLYLLDHSTKSYKSSFRHLLKHQEFIADPDETQHEEQEYPLPELVKLPLEYYQKITISSIQSEESNRSEISSGIPRLIGIVSHQLLQWICDNHPQTINHVPWNLVHTELKQLGLNQKVQQTALSMIKNQISQMYQNEIGQWILSRHENEQNEYELLVEHQNKLVTRIIDRTFIENDTQWIIDFKTGKEDINTLQQHRQQLNEYGYYLSNCTELPIRCGLYYLANGHWINWQYEMSA